MGETKRERMGSESLVMKHRQHEQWILKNLLVKYLPYNSSLPQKWIPSVTSDLCCNYSFPWEDTSESSRPADFSPNYVHSVLQVSIVPQFPCRSHNNSLKGRRNLIARGELAIFRHRGRLWERAVSTLFPWLFFYDPSSSLWISFLGFINLMLSWFSSYLPSPSQCPLLVLLPLMHWNL